MKKENLTLPGIIVLMLPFAFIYFFSSSPSYKFSSDQEAGLIVSFKKFTDRVHTCSEEEKDELVEKTKNLRPHIRYRKSLPCGSRERVPLGLKIWIDNKVVADKIIIAAGFKNDRACYPFEKFIIPTGKHHIKIAMRDSKKDDNKFDYFFEKIFSFDERKIIVVSFDSENQKFFVRKKTEKIEGEKPPRIAQKRGFVWTDWIVIFLMLSIVTSVLLGIAVKHLIRRYRPAER